MKNVLVEIAHISISQDTQRGDDVILAVTDAIYDANQKVGIVVWEVRAYSKDLSGYHPSFDSLGS